MFFIPDSEIGGTIIFLSLSFELGEMQNFSRDPAKKVSQKQTGDVCSAWLSLQNPASKREVEQLSRVSADCLAASHGNGNYAIPMRPHQKIFWD
jgi:hypothetical protein